MIHANTPTTTPHLLSVSSSSPPPPPPPSPLPPSLSLPPLPPSLPPSLHDSRMIHGAAALPTRFDFVTAEFQSEEVLAGRGLDAPDDVRGPAVVVLEGKYRGRHIRIKLLCSWRRSFSKIVMLSRDTDVGGRAGDDDER